MIYKGIIIEKGQGEQDVIDINGLYIKKITSEVPVTINFNGSDKIGIAKVYRHEDVLKADIEIKDPVEGWPCISGKVLKREGNIIKEFELTSVSISSTPNHDKSINTINNQLKNKL